MIDSYHEVAEDMEYDDKGNEVFTNNNITDLPDTLIIIYKGKYSIDVRQYLIDKLKDKYQYLGLYSMNEDKGLTFQRI